ncbi:MAG: AzlD domain-containing protein [Actinomycetota bacterium]
MSLWTGILVGALGCYLTKLAGLSIPARVLDDPRVRRVGEFLPVALLAALVGLQSFAEASGLVVDAPRLAAVAAAAIAVRLRAPFLAVVALAAATAALLRLVG